MVVMTMIPVMIKKNIKNNYNNNKYILPQFTCQYLAVLIYLWSFLTAFVNINLFFIRFCCVAALDQLQDLCMQHSASGHQMFFSLLETSILGHCERDLCLEEGRAYLKAYRPAHMRMCLHHYYWMMFSFRSKVPTPSSLLGLHSSNISRVWLR